MMFFMKGVGLEWQGCFSLAKMLFIPNWKRKWTKISRLIFVSTPLSTFELSGWPGLGPQFAPLHARELPRETNEFSEKGKSNGFETPVRSRKAKTQHETLRKTKKNSRIIENTKVRSAKPFMIALMYSKRKPRRRPLTVIGTLLPTRCVARTEWCWL